MLEQCMSVFLEVDCAIMCAAVADFTPEHFSGSKLKRGDDDLIIRMKPTSDIAGALGQAKNCKATVDWFCS